MLSIEISLEKQAFQLGEPIIATIFYINGRSSAVRLEDPSKSFNVEMHVVDTNTREDLNYAMGSVEVTQLSQKEDAYALVEPIPDNVEIDAKGKLSFQSDINDRLYLHPGEFECSLIDGARASNRQILSVKYTQDSVDLLFKIVKDTSVGYSRREWAADWLKELAPEFSFKLTPDNEPGQVKMKNELANEKAYKDFSTWWKNSMGSKETARKLEQINHARY